MKVLILLTIIVTLAAFTSCAKSPKTLEERFERWIQRHNKKFATQEDKDALFKDWQRRQTRVDDHNKKFLKGEVTFKQATWRHSDLSRAEKRALLTGISPPPKTLRSLSNTTVSYPTFPTGPKSIDWNALGRVTPIRDQGWCGSCWAFGATDLVEAALRKNKTSNATAAPQELVDCRPEGTKGCTNGWPSMALVRKSQSYKIPEMHFHFFGSNMSSKMESQQKQTTRTAEMRAPAATPQPRGSQRLRLSMKFQQGVMKLG